MTMDWRAWYEQALSYDEYLKAHANETQLPRWEAAYERIALTPAQKELVENFQREMNVLVLSGTWCGDCVNQVPILQRIGEASERVHVRILERDAVPELRDALMINGGQRVPVAVFLSEDFMECSRFGDRVLAFYRQMAKDQLGPACPIGIVPPGQEVLEQATQEWINEFERVQLMLRLSTRLREKHGD